MKMVVEGVMGLPTLYVLQSRADFVQQVKGLGAAPDVFLNWVLRFRFRSACLIIELCPRQF